ncbi:MAG: glycosyltransferase family 2 protein [Minisyncoccia bacterium]
MNRYFQIKFFAVFAIIFNISTVIVLIRAFNLSIYWLVSFIVVFYSCTFIIISSLIKLLGLPNEKKDSIYKINLFNKQTVDIFLPIAGEDMSILQKTWEYVFKAKQCAEQNNLVVNVYVLNDNVNAYKDQKLYKYLIEKYQFQEIARTEHSFKKAGNIKNAYKNTNGEYIIIFDADFCPTEKFIIYTISRMMDMNNAGKKIGIYQTPQAFQYDNLTGLEKGACNIQGFFYDIVQVARNSFKAPICVGSNAVYYRPALDEIGGNYLIEHSEDVWTGFALTRQGWTVHYDPHPLAFGISPDHLYSYYKQQTRWCLGSMSLIKSKFFWTTKLSIMQRLSYLSGFMFYVYCIVLLALPIFSIFHNQELPATINTVLWIQIGLSLYIIPNLIYKKADINTMIAHLFATWSYTIAIFQYILGSMEKWEATGASGKTKKTNNWYNGMIISIYVYTIFITVLLINNIINDSISPLTFYIGLNTLMHWIGIIYYMFTKKK